MILFRELAQHFLKFFLTLLLFVLTTACIHRTKPETTLLDCPLKDAPFTLQSPLMDIMLSEAASAAVNRHMNGVLNNLPENYASTQAPSFSAILNLGNFASMAGIGDEHLHLLDQELHALPVSDSDRQARCARYDDERPKINIPEGYPKILVFEKMTGFRDDPSVTAAAKLLRDMAEQNNWSMVFTDKGGAMHPNILRQFDLVIWNNNSGDVLTLSQRRAFIDYMESGGGYVGIHGAGGDPVYFWDWYTDTLLGTNFIGHSSDPQFQQATVHMESDLFGINTTDTRQSWQLTEEWYSFRPNPRSTGSTIIATIDESTYNTTGYRGHNIAMGDDHPIAWARCVNKGRSFYSAIGHLPEVYSDPHHKAMLLRAVMWASGDVGSHCVDARYRPPH